MEKIRNFKRRLIAALFAFIALFHFRNNSEALSLKKVVTALASPFAIFSGCTNEPDDPKPDTRPPTISSVTADKADLQLPDETSITLNATAASADGSAVKAYLWSVKAAPEGANPVIANRDQAATAVTGLTAAGTYTFELEVTGSNDVKAISSVVTVIVKAEVVVEPPVINNIVISGAAPNSEGKYKNTDEITLSGNPAIEGGAYEWTYTTNPAGKTLNFDQTAASPAISGFEKGVTYTFELTVTKNGKTSEKKSVTVSIAENVKPTANAGSDQDVTLSNILIVALNGGGSDDEVISYAWTCSSYTADKGNITGTAEDYRAAVNSMINTNNGQNVSLALRKAGTYVFELTVKDKEGLSDTKSVKVVVEPYTATKDVGVTFAAFQPNTTSPTSVSMVPVYTPTGGWDKYFSAGDILNKITYSFQGDNHATVYDYPDDVITRAKQVELNLGAPPWPAPLYKQTFYYKEIEEENKLGEYTVFIGDFSGSGYLGGAKVAATKNP